MIEIYHNPRCSKSRQALALLEEAGVAYSVRLYLTDPPSVDEINTILKKLDCPPREMMRVGEAVYKDLNLASADDATLIEAMSLNPILIERPIIIKDQQAVIGRPPERVKDLL